MVLSSVRIGIVVVNKDDDGVIVEKKFVIVDNFCKISSEM